MEDYQNEIRNSQIHKNDLRNRICNNNNSNIETEVMNNDLNKFIEVDNDCNRNKNTVDCICRIAFNEEEEFKDLKDEIMTSLSSIFKTKKIDIEFLEDTKFLDISVIKKLKKDIPLFMISVDASPKFKSQSESIPSYKRSIKDVLDFSKLNEINEHCERPKTNLCFNCSGSHALKDCPEPRNQQKINKARKQFLTKNERYHIDVDQRLAHLKPGKLSNGLKNALGLKSRELPSFFYRMRILGYPPGWLEDAKISNSGITLINSEDGTIQTIDYDEKSFEPEEHKYDISKIISFPGFNVDPGSGYYDDYKYHNVPAMHPQQKKDFFIKTFGDNLATQGYKRKKNVPFPSNPEIDNVSESVSGKEIKSKIVRLDNQSAFETTSLNIEQPLNVDILKQYPTSEESNAVQKTEIRTNNQRSSPSLADLEAQQSQLLEALQKSSGSIISEDSFIDDTHVKINCDSVGGCSIDNRNTSLISETNNILGTPKTVILPSNTKVSVLGTPVLKFSIFDQLPNGDNFKEGVSDVINFENLPDSTGKYEEMKMVLNKIRMKINKLNSPKN